MDSDGTEKILQTPQDIRDRRDEIINRLSNFQEALRDRQSKLEIMKRHHHFHNNAASLEDWINDKLVNYAPNFMDDLHNLDVNRMKYDKLREEIQSKEEHVYLGLKQEGGRILSALIGGDELCSRVEQRLVKLDELWRALLSLLQRTSRQLEATVQYVRLVKRINELTGWITEKHAYLTGNNPNRVVRNLSQAECLHEQFECFQRDFTHQQQQKDSVELEVGQLLDGHELTRPELIETRLDELRAAWQNFVDAVQSQTSVVRQTLSLMQWSSDASALIALLSQLKYGEWREEADDRAVTELSLASVQQLMRENELCHKELAMLRTDVESVGRRKLALIEEFPGGTEADSETDADADADAPADGDKHCVIEPSRKHDLENKWSELELCLQTITDNAAEVQRQLNVELIRARFEKEYSAIKSKLQEIDSKIVESSHTDISSVDRVVSVGSELRKETLLELHEQIKVELDLTETKLTDNLRNEQALNELNYPFVDQINEKGDELKELLNSVSARLNATLDRLQQQLIYYRFLKDANQLNNWLEKQQAILDKLGDPDSSENFSQIKLHEFQTNLKNHEDLTNAFFTSANQLFADDEDEENKEEKSDENNEQIEDKDPEELKPRDKDAPDDEKLEQVNTTENKEKPKRRPNFAVDEIRSIRDDLLAKKVRLDATCIEKKDLVHMINVLNDFDKLMDEMERLTEENLQKLQNTALESDAPTKLEEVIGELPLKSDCIRSINYSLEDKQIKMDQIHNLLHEELAKAIRPLVDNNDDRVESSVDQPDFKSNANEIRSERLNNLNTPWKQLSETAKAQLIILDKVNDQITLQQRINEKKIQLDELSSLITENFGKNLIESLVLKKKNDELINEASRIQERLEEYRKKIAAPESSLTQLVDKVKEQGDKLISNLTKCSQDLSNAIKLHQVHREMTDLIAWIAENLPFATDQSNLGENLIDVNRLIKRQKQLTAELEARKPTLELLLSQAAELIPLESVLLPAKLCPSCQQQKDILADQWQKLISATANYGQQLNDAKRSHQYLANAREALIWLKEKEWAVDKVDVGRDENSTAGLLKACKGLNEDLKNYAVTLSELEADQKSCKLQKLRQNVESDGEEEALLPTDGIDSKVAQTTHVDMKGIKNLADEQAKLQCIYEKIIEHSIKQENKLEKSVKMFQMRRDLKSLDEQPKIHMETSSGQVESAPPKKRAKQDLDDDEESEIQMEIVESVESQAPTRQKPLESVDSEPILLYDKKQVDDAIRENLNKKAKLEEMEAEVKNLRDVGLLDEMNELNEKVQHLKQKQKESEAKLMQRLKDIEDLHAVQNLCDDCDETSELIQKKRNRLAQSKDTHGDSISEVTLLMRKHEAFQTDVQTVKTNVDKLNDQSTSMIVSHSNDKSMILKHLDEMNNLWNMLHEEVNTHNALLLDSWDLQKFLTEANDLIAFVNNLKTTIEYNDELSNNLMQAEAQLEMHEELKQEIDVKLEQSAKLTQMRGAELINKQHFASPRIESKLSDINEAINELLKKWENRQGQLKFNYEKQRALVEAERLTDWMLAKEESILNKPDKDGGERFDALIKKYEDFDRTIEIKEGQINAILQNLDQLNEKQTELDGDPELNHSKQTLIDKWENLKKLLLDRKAELSQVQTLQTFFRDADDLELWINAKHQEVQRETYQDPSVNTQARMQNHAAFAAEIAATAPRFHAILENGNLLLEKHQKRAEKPKEDVDGDDADRTETEESRGKTDERTVDDRDDDETTMLAKQLAKLQSDWQSLYNENQIVLEKLQEEKERAEWAAQLKNEEIWINEAELATSQSELITDDMVDTVDVLLAQHNLVKDDINKHEELMTRLEHEPVWETDAFREKKKEILVRFEKVMQVSQHRTVQLGKAKKLADFFGFLNDQLAWIMERQYAAQSTEYGRDSVEVKDLIKKNERLQSEISAHQPVIENVAVRGEELIRESQFVNSQQILNDIQKIQKEWKSLEDLMAIRTRRLADSEQYINWIDKIDEEETWISDQTQFMAGEVFGETISAALRLLKKHNLFTTELETVRHGISEQICTEGRELCEHENYNSAAIEQRSAEFLQKIEQLTKMSSVHRKKLWNNSQVLQFIWHSDILESTISEKLTQLNNFALPDNLTSVESVMMRLDNFQKGFESSFDAEHRQNYEIFTKSFEKYQETDDPDSQTATEIENNEKVEKKRVHTQEKIDELVRETSRFKTNILELKDMFVRLDDSMQKFAMKAPKLFAQFEKIEEDLIDPVRCDSLEEVGDMIADHEKLCSYLTELKLEMEELLELDKFVLSIQQIPSSSSQQTNPYTWIKMKLLEETWQRLNQLATDRTKNLNDEKIRQNQNKVLRLEFAKHANNFYDDMQKIKREIANEEISDSQSSLLAYFNAKKDEIQLFKNSLNLIENLNRTMQEKLIFINRHTDHSCLKLSQEWDQLKKLINRMIFQASQEEQITPANILLTKEMTIMFMLFDRERTGFLNHQRLRECLRALFSDASYVDENMPKMLEAMDPENQGRVGLNEFLNILPTIENQRIMKVKDLQKAFRTLTERGFEPHIRRRDLLSKLPDDIAQYCLEHLPKTEDKEYFDYNQFARDLLIN